MLGEDKVLYVNITDSKSMSGSRVGLGSYNVATW